MDQVKLENYKKILSEIAEERGLFELATHIKSFALSIPNLSSALGADIKEYKIPESKDVVPLKTGSGGFKITVMPEATCDGCQ